MITKLSLQMPPNSVFQPVTSAFQNNLTFTEYLLGILKKLNEVIAVTNENSQYIKDFDAKYQELLTEFTELKTEFEGLKDEILAEVSVKLENFYNSVENEISLAVNYLKAYTDSKCAILDNKIDQVVLGNIDVIDPTTGVVSPLQEVLNNIAGVGADNLTATEYDALELTATAYDAYDLSAFDYDYHAKSILTA